MTQYYGFIYPNISQINTPLPGYYINESSLVSISLQAQNMTKLGIARVFLTDA